MLHRAGGALRGRTLHVSRETLTRVTRDIERTTCTVLALVMHYVASHDALGREVHQNV